MHDDQDIWFRIGHALERARPGDARAAPRVPDAARGASRREVAFPPAGDGRPRPADAPEGDPAPPEGEPSAGSESGRGAVDSLLLIGAGKVVTRLLRSWPARSSPQGWDYLRAGGAGAGAALLTELASRLVQKERILSLDQALLDAVVAGAGRGIVYAALVEPRLPGPPPMRGAAFAALEYGLASWGGLSQLLEELAPSEDFPLWSRILRRPLSPEASLVEEIAFGFTLGYLYESGRWKRGMEEVE